MRKFFTILILLNFYLITNAQRPFQWDLDSYHNYPTFITVKLESNGISIGDDFVFPNIRNISSSHVSFSLKFIFTDFCGKSTSHFMSGGVNLKPGESDNTSFLVTTTCKQLKTEGGKQTGIASVTCQVSGFKNITELENNLKAEQQRKQKERDDERAKKENEQKEKAKQTETDRKKIISSNQSENLNDRNILNPNNGGSYYSNQNQNPNTTRKPTWEETNARIKAEQLQEYNDQRTRIAESQRRSKELDDQISSGITELAGMVGNIIQQGREERERKEAKRERAAQEVQQARFAEENRIKERARQKALQLELRNSLFSEFTDGVIPLSSQRVGVRQLFYFTYAYDKNSLEGTAPSIFLSNIFSIAQYADDTWPFKTGIIKEMRKLQSKTTIVLMGYFTLKSEAEETRNRFKDLANKSDFSIQDFTYNGKKLESKSSSDFWENDNKQTEGNAGKAKLIMAKGDEDFWETGQQKKKMVAETKKEEQKKKIEESKKKTVNKDDFWNN